MCSMSGVVLCAVLAVMFHNQYMLDYRPALAGLSSTYSVTEQAVILLLGPPVSCLRRGCGRLSVPLQTGSTEGRTHSHLSDKVMLPVALMTYICRTTVMNCTN